MRPKPDISREGDTFQEAVRRAVGEMLHTPVEGVGIRIFAPFLGAVIQPCFAQIGVSCIVKDHHGLAQRVDVKAARAIAVHFLVHRMHEGLRGGEEFFRGLG